MMHSLHAPAHRTGTCRRDVQVADLGTTLGLDPTLSPLCNPNPSCPFCSQLLLPTHPPMVPPLLPSHAPCPCGSPQQWVQNGQAGSASSIQKKPPPCGYQEVNLAPALPQLCLMHPRLPPHQGQVGRGTCQAKSLGGPDSVRGLYFSHPYPSPWISTLLIVITLLGHIGS